MYFRARKTVKQVKRNLETTNWTAGRLNRNYSHSGAIAHGFESFVTCGLPTAFETFKRNLNYIGQFCDGFLLISPTYIQLKSPLATYHNGLMQNLTQILFGTCLVPWDQWAVVSATRIKTIITISVTVSPEHEIF